MEYHIIIIEPVAEADLKNIYEYICQNDSCKKAKSFLTKLQKAIESLSFMPYHCRNSLYIDDGKTKNLIYHGYTICYHIDGENVHIVAVFRQR